LPIPALKLVEALGVALEEHGEGVVIGAIGRPDGGREGDWARNMFAGRISRCAISKKIKICKLDITHLDNRRYEHQ
jgi:hypothetical protein